MFSLLTRKHTSRDTHTHRQRLQTHILRPDSDPFKIHVHARDDDSHLAWPFEPQHIGLLAKNSIPFFFAFKLLFYSFTAFLHLRHSRSRQRPTPVWCCSPPAASLASSTGCCRCHTPWTWCPWGWTWRGEDNKRWKMRTTKLVVLGSKDDSRESC